MPDKPKIPKIKREHLQLVAEIREVASSLGYIALAAANTNELLEKILERLSQEKP
ncbi:MAG: hypothetical protein AAB654_09770 [Acidobacteriota bacterium]